MDFGGLGYPCGVGRVCLGHGLGCSPAPHWENGVAAKGLKQRADGFFRGLAGFQKCRFYSGMSYLIRIPCILTAASCLLIGVSHAQGTRGGAPQPPLTPVDVSIFKTKGALGLFLLVGQSNMKGRGAIDMEPKIDARVCFFHASERKWFIARDPLHALGTPDRIDRSDNAGTGPGMSFARAILEKTDDAAIGLIPAAEGGVPITAYMADGKLYARSLEMVRQATELAPVKAPLRAILWLQGESDATNQEQVDAYEARLLDLVDRYRRDFGDPNLPFIACTIGSFIAEGGKAKRFPFSKEINEILLRLPEKRKHTACVDARDIKGHIGDGLHYHTEAQQKIGQRFAKAYQEVRAR